MRYENLILDWDGVFVKTPKIWFETILSVAWEYGIELTPRQVMEQSGDLRTAVKHGIPERYIAEYGDRIRKLAKPRALRAPFYEGAIELLEKLRSSGVKLAVLSSNSSARDYIERKEVDHFFQLILSGKEVPNYKPHPEGVLLALDRLKGTKSNTALVGDAWTDMRAARDAGVDSVLFFPREHLRTHDLDEIRAHKPTHTVSSHAELSKLLIRNGRPETRQRSRATV